MFKHLYLLISILSISILSIYASIYATSNIQSDTGTTTTYNHILVNMEPIYVTRGKVFYVLRDACGGCARTSTFMFDPEINSYIKFLKKDYFSLNPYGTTGGTTTEKWSFRAMKRGDYTLNFTYGAINDGFTIYSVLVHVE